MEVTRDEACALKTARALSYIDFSNLESWYGQFGFIKIFHSLKEEGSDLAWALMVGAINRALAGDGRLPRDVFSRILRENRVTLQHLSELYPESAPVRMQGGAFRVKDLETLPDGAAPRMKAALRHFVDGEWGLQQLKDELYRLHTGEMRDSLYYHTLLAARTVQHPISAHMLEKALQLFPSGHISGDVVTPALLRLERLQKEHLGAAMKWDPGPRNTVLEEFTAAPHSTLRTGTGAFATASAQDNNGATHRSEPSPAGAGNGTADYRSRAARFLEERGVPEYNRSAKLSDLLGYDEGRLAQLLEPFLLRYYSSDGELGDEGGFILAVGPPEVDKASLLSSIARGLNLPCSTVTYREFASEWTGETEQNLLRAIGMARALSERNRNRPSVLIFDDGRHPEAGGRSRASSHDVLLVLGELITGPRRREVLGEPGRGSVIIVATAVQSAGMEPGVRSRAEVIRFEPPDAKGLEKLLIQNTVGRYYHCDLERMSFEKLAGEALGLSARSVSRVAQRAKLLALKRRANELGLCLTSATERARARIKDSYCITEDDLLDVVREEKLALRHRPLQAPPERKPGSARRNQPPLYKWSEGNRRATSEEPGE